MLQQAKWPHVRFRNLLDQHTLAIFTALAFSLPLYVSKYHVRRNDELPGGVLYDSTLDFVIRVTNIFENVFGSPNHTANKNSCPWLWSIFEQYFYWLCLLLWNCIYVGALMAVGGPFLLYSDVSSTSTADDMTLRTMVDTTFTNPLFIIGWPRFCFGEE